MLKFQEPIEEKFLSLIKEMIKVIRSFQNESAFCGDITFSQFWILDSVAKSSPLEMSKLHQLLAVEKSTTTRLVEPLIKGGYLVKIPSLEDSRALNLEITKKGAESHKKVWLCISGFLHNVISGIPEKKREDLLGAFNLFIKSFNTCCVDNKCNI